MTPFKRRPHLRIAGMLADDTTPVDVAPDPNAPPAQPPPPRTVSAQASDLLPDTSTTTTAAAASTLLGKHSAIDLVLQGIFVGVGYGLASELLKMVLGGSANRAKPRELGGLGRTRAPRRKRED